MRLGIDIDDRSRALSVAAVHSADMAFVHDPRTNTDYALLQVDALSGLWVVRTRFPSGSVVQRHLHSGPVTAVTLAGEWGYPELAAWCAPGDYLVEEAGTVHSLTVAERGTADVIFSITGCIVYFAADGSVERIDDWRSMLADYESGCDALGRRPTVIGCASSLARSPGGA